MKTQNIPHAPDGLAVLARRTRSLHRLRFSLLLLLGIFSKIYAVETIPVSPQDLSASAGQWHGQWHNNSGYVYTAVIQMPVTTEGALGGEITWTVTAAPRRAYLGKSGVERISCTYDRKTRQLSFCGIELIDPKRILALDVYRMVLSADGAGLEGESRTHHNTWEGVFKLTRS